MKLRFGKDAWLELQHVSLDSQVVRGTRVFGGTSDAARAAVAATRAVAQTFVAPGLHASGSDPTAKTAAAERVDAAVFRDLDGNVRVVYKEIVVRFEPAVAQARRNALLAKYGLEIRKENPFATSQIIAFDPTRKYIAARMVDLANELTETDEVLFAFPNFVSEFRRTSVPKPTAQQWHLDLVEATSAWGRTQGERTTVAILDDGVDVKHPNLRRNIRRNPDPDERKDKFGRDFFVGEDAPDHFDPTPKRFRAPFDVMDGNDIHGTPCAGVVASSGETSDVFGIAPKAKILPVKIFHADDLATESRVANAIRYASRFADILSCSWSGPVSPDIELALEEAGAGRGGKGCPVFCATGNEASPAVAYPARSKFSIAVGASTDQEQRAAYSNQGPEIAIVAPSSGGTRGIFTTDVSTTKRGFNIGSEHAGGADGLHTNDFGGTSSATPLAAGLAALILSANPRLTRDEVRDVLQKTVDKIGPSSSYKGGFSKEFGFGRVNAAKAVAEAERLAAQDNIARRSTQRVANASSTAARKSAAARNNPARKRESA